MQGQGNKVKTELFSLYSYKRIQNSIKRKRDLRLWNDRKYFQSMLTMQ